MKTDKIVFGVILIILGVLFLFANLNLISWDFVSGLWKLWPLVLVLWGLDLIIKENHLLKTLLFLLLVLIAFVVYFYSEKEKITTSSIGEDHAYATFSHNSELCNY